jgi:hypothetical protein
MVGDSPFVCTVAGQQAAAEALRSLPAKLRVRAIRNGLAAGGRVFRDEARRLTPVLAVPVRRQGQLIRKPGTVRDAINVRTSKRARRAGDVGVFVNVRPAKRLARGAFNPFDPFYWRWLEFGRQGRAGRAARGQAKGRRAVAPMRAFRMLQRAAGRAGQAVQVISAALAKSIQRMNSKNAQP